MNAVVSLAFKIDNIKINIVIIYKTIYHGYSKPIVSKATKFMSS